MGAGSFAALVPLSAMPVALSNPLGQFLVLAGIAAAITFGG